jgi:hypothetical protein
MPVRSAGHRARANPEIAVDLDSQPDQGAIARSDARSRMGAKKATAVSSAGLFRAAGLW